MSVGVEGVTVYCDDTSRWARRKPVRIGEGIEKKKKSMAELEKKEH